VITLQNCVPERSYGGVAARGKRAATGATGGRVPRQQAVWCDVGPSARISPRRTWQSNTAGRKV